MVLLKICLHAMGFGCEEAAKKRPRKPSTSCQAKEPRPCPPSYTHLNSLGSYFGRSCGSSNSSMRTHMETEYPWLVGHLSIFSATFRPCSTSAWNQHEQLVRQHTAAST